MANLLARSIYQKFDKVLYKVSELDPYNHRWSARVKVLRIFKHMVGVRELFNLILADDKDDKIHAVLCEDIANIFVEKIVEGDWIVLFDFELKPVVGEFRISMHSFMINCHPRTMFVNAPPGDISSRFSFVDLDAIRDGRLDPNVCVDVIGRVVNVGNFRGRHTFGSDKRTDVYFELVDERGSRIQVLLKKGYSEDFLEAWSTCNQQLAICVMRYMSIVRRKGFWRVETSFKCAQVLLDPPITEVKSLRELLITNNT